MSVDKVVNNNHPMLKIELSQEDWELLKIYI